MLARLGAFTVRRRRVVLISAVVGLIVAGGIGGSVVKRLSTGGFSDPNSESARAEAQLLQTFHFGNPNLVLLVTAKKGTVDSPAVVARGRALTLALSKEKDIAGAFSYWTLGSPPPLRSKTNTQALVLARISGGDDHVRERAGELTTKYTRADTVIAVGVGGEAAVFKQVGTRVEQDLRKAEAITFPIVLVLLILVFGSAIAAGLPLIVAILAVVGTLLVLRIIAAVTDVSIFSLNITTGLGIGLGIDYALFIVSRYREEVRAGRSIEAAVVRTVETAGRTVLFSAVTVAVSLSALLVFPLFFLRSFAYAGIAVVAIAAVGAVIVLPAVLAALGPRVEKFVLWHHTPKPIGEGAWHRIALFVMRRPWGVSLVVVALLLVLGAPFLGVKFGLPDDRVLPPGSTTRLIQDQIRHNFVSEEASALSVVATHAGTPGRARNASIDSYARALSKMSGVSRVDALTGSYIAGNKVLGSTPASARFQGRTATWLSVVPAVEPYSPQGEKLVRQIRSTRAPVGAILVAGPSATLVDSKAGISGKLPLAGGIIAIVTIVVLFMMTGSVVIPLKALVLNILSLSATFGAMVWVFQEGHLSKALGFTATGTLDSSNPILMFCIAFGLSMDYEVFLLSRIKEEHDKTGDNVGSVAIGLERTGRIVTAAAALLAIVFLAFVTSGITFIKMFGLGMALAVVMDATLIRGALVPAFMRLAGGANWWAPRPLRRFHDRFGLREAADDGFNVEHVLEHTG
jgi:putative drug exporter of the RND superfamily